jgi:hypothetical protein
MLQSRVNLGFVSVALLAMIAACAGCWQKIEYKSHPSPNKNPPSTPSKQTAANDHPTENAATSNSGAGEIGSVPGGIVSPNDPSSLPPTPGPPQKTVDDDRYAVSPTPPASPDGVGSAAARSSPAADSSSPANPTPPPAAETATTPSALPSNREVAPQQLAKSNDDDRYSAHSAAADTSSSPEASQSPVTPIPPINPKSQSQPTAAASTSSNSGLSNSRLAAWTLGSRLSLAALANDRQLAAKNVPVWLADAKSAAKSLNTTISDLPPPGPTDPETNASKQVMDYLLINGQRIGHDLTKQHGPVESSLFEVALKSNLLLLIYRPGTPTVDTVSAALQEAAVRAKLPEALWQPLVLAINTQAPPKEVQAAIKKLHSVVEQYLASGALPSKR